LKSATGLVEERQAQTLSPVIEVLGLSKSYRGVEVLHSVNLTVQRQELFGLVGPDGSGKTTILKILTGLSDRDSGSVLVLGKTPFQARQQTGYVSQQFSLYGDLSVEENLRYAAGSHELTWRQARERSYQLLKKVGLAAFAGRLACRLSGGMKQKLALCCALIARPQLLLLDEPTAGVDPLARLEFYEILQDLKREGVSIVEASSSYEDAGRFDRVALLSRGIIDACGQPERLIDSLKLGRLMLYTDDNRRACELLMQALKSGTPGLADIYLMGDHLEVLLKETGASGNSIKEILQAGNITVTQTQTGRPGLENVFMNKAGARRALLGSEPDLTAVLSGRSGVRTGAAIEARYLSKRYGQFSAVSDLNLEVAYGEIYGLLGANGAGKTTTVQMLCGLQQPGSGTAQVGGESRNLRSANLRRRCGYMSQKSTLYTDLTVEENLEFYSAVYEISAGARQHIIENVLGSCRLSDCRKQLVAHLPRGVRQRVAFAAAIMHAPEILFLDEPSAGVDPAARRHLWQMIHRLADSGTAILVTTHDLAEAEYCNRLGIMAASRLLAEGSPSEIKSYMDSASLEEALIKLVREKAADAC
jgi:ABC-2 type transport system ATP-binding protein